MSCVLRPWHLLLIAMTAMLQRELTAENAYLKEENRVLREQLGPERLRFTHDQRVRLATKAKALGAKTLAGLNTIVTPETLLSWYHKLVAKKYDGSANRGPGRPATHGQIQDLVLRLANENRSWGYSRIQGALMQLGHQVSRGTIANILRRNGLDPAPKRTKGTTWTEFIRSHRDVMAAADFFSIEVWTPTGLKRFMAFFVIDIQTRRVQIAGISPAPTGAWVEQMARNLTDAEDGFLRGKRYLIHDRDSLYTAGFTQTLAAAGVKTVKLPARSPNLNATAERFVLSIKSECLDRMIFFSERQLRRAVSEYVRIIITREPIKV